MRLLPVELRSRAERQLDAIEEIVARRDTPAAALQYRIDILLAAQKIALAPNSGTRRKTRYGWMRVRAHKRRIAISYVVRRGWIDVVDIAYFGQRTDF